VTPPLPEIPQALAQRFWQELSQNVGGLLSVLSGAAFQTVAFLALAAAALAPWEALSPRRQRWKTGNPSVLTDLLFATAGQMGVRLGVLLLLEKLWGHALAWSVEAPLWSWISLPSLRTAVEIASGLLLFDFGGYVYHRLAHAVPVLWRLHAVHHSSAHLDWLASFREHPLEALAITTFQNLPLILLGIPLGAHASVIALLKLTTVFVHADIDVPVGPWTAVVATPAFHRRHHHVDGPSRNFATLFPFLDRLFDTYERADVVRQSVGLDAPMPASFGRLLLQPLSPRRSTVQPVSLRGDLTIRS
jgi:sterol desaturase/sphingolipid hydroxylase (fatty acid hydroxylase superfamily)